MKLKHVEKYTFQICMNWLNKQSLKNTRRLKMTLQRWSKKRPRYKGAESLDDYGYEANNIKDVMFDVSYCSDRMNQGRAKALLRLLNEFCSEIKL